MIAAMTLDVVIRHPLGRITLDVSFKTDAGLTAIVGPSGAGKTSVLDAMAGILRPAESRIVCAGRVLEDSARGVSVPAHQRRIGYVRQESLLFPHLTVRQNLLYGRWFTPTSERRIHEPDVISLLDLEMLLARRPGRLSGESFSGLRWGARCSPVLSCCCSTSRWRRWMPVESTTSCPISIACARTCGFP